MEFDGNLFGDFERFESSTEDFLSNGFHQFYTELQDDLIEFEIGGGVSEGGFQPDGDAFLPIVVDQVNELSEDFLSASPMVEEPTEVFLLDMDFIAAEVHESGFNLPAKTPLCNDSCDIFLQETVDNLKPSPSASTSSTEEEEPKSYPCTFGDCQKIYAKPTHLKAHLRRHLSDKPYKCDWINCVWRFSRSDELARHRRSHLGIKPYQCDFCSKKFARSDHLAKHRRVHERKLMAANRGKEFTWPKLPRGRPGRKPKKQLQTEQNC